MCCNKLAKGAANSADFVFGYKNHPRFSIAFILFKLRVLGVLLGNKPAENCSSSAARADAFLRRQKQQFLPPC